MEPYLLFLYLGRLSLLLLLLLLILSSLLEFMFWASHSPTPSVLEETLPIFDFVAQNLKSHPIKKLALGSIDAIGTWDNYALYPSLLNWTSAESWCFCDEIIEENGRSITIPYLSHIGTCTADQMALVDKHDITVRCRSMQKSTLNFRNYLLKSFKWKTTKDYAFFREGEGEAEQCVKPLVYQEELSLCAKSQEIITDLKYLKKSDLSSPDSYIYIGDLNLITSPSETEGEEKEIRGGDNQIFVSKKVAGFPIVRLGVSYGQLPCLDGKIPVSYNLHQFNINGEKEECGAFGTDEEIFQIVDSIKAESFFEFNSRNFFGGKNPQNFNLMHIDRFKKAIKDQKAILYLERKLVMKGNKVCDRLLKEQPKEHYGSKVEALKELRSYNFYVISGVGGLIALIFLIYWVLTRHFGVRKEQAGIYFFWISHLVAVLLSAGVLTFAVFSLMQVEEIEELYSFLFGVSLNKCFLNSKKINKIYHGLASNVKKTYEFSLKFIYFDLVLVGLFLLFEICLWIVWGSRFKCMHNLEGGEEILREEDEEKNEK